VSKLHVAESETEPEVVFDFAENTFALRGMSYMEDVMGFYEPLLEKLEAHVSSLSDATINFDFALSYFNSSSSRIVFQIFTLLDAAAEAGNQVTITWHHSGDDDMLEQGEEFAEDLETATFVMADSD